MKKTLALILALLMCVSFFAACAGKNNSTDETTDGNGTSAAADTTAEENSYTGPIRVFTLKGPTGMGMAKLMSDNDAGATEQKYSFTVASSPDEFTGEIVQGNFEIAAVPTNLAAVLNSKTNGAVSVAAVNTLGVLYILENGETVKSINDLEGKTIYSSGQGAVPEYALNYILSAFGVKCEVIYEAEHDAVVSDLMSGKATIAVLPEPKVTAALKNENAPAGLRTALDLTKLWDEACAIKGDSSTLYMGCVIVNNKWADANSDAVDKFIEEYKNSVNFVNSDYNAASEMIANYGIIPKAGLAKAAIPSSNIVCIDGSQMKKGLSGFYNVLFGYNPASVGGQLPEDSFYYGA